MADGNIVFYGDAPPPTSSSPPTHDADQDREVCRICRTPGSTVERLRYPCVCSGSIKFVHEECLYQWLSVNHKAYCEALAENAAIAVLLVFVPIYLGRMILYSTVTSNLYAIVIGYIPILGLGLLLDLAAAPLMIHVDATQILFWHIDWAYGSLCFNHWLSMVRHHMIQDSETLQKSERFATNQIEVLSATLVGNSEQFVVKCA